MSLPEIEFTLLADADALLGAAITAASRVEPGIDWELDDDGDVLIPLRFTRGLAGVTQGISIRVRMFRGEWFLNLDEGIPYFDNDTVTEAEALLGQLFDQQKALTAFRRVITAAPYVESILSLAVSFEGTTRTLSVTWRVKSALGVVEGTTEVPNG